MILKTYFYSLLCYVVFREYFFHKINIFLMIFILTRFKQCSSSYRGNIRGTWETIRGTAKVPGGNYSFIHTFIVLFILYWDSLLHPSCLFILYWDSLLYPSCLFIIQLLFINISTLIFILVSIHLIIHPFLTLYPEPAI